MDMPSWASGSALAGRAPPVAVIGAGFSGTITALHLLRTLPPECPVLLCERAVKFAAGTAYATERNDHLLNVRAANMSAFAEQADGFERWLRACAFDDTLRVRETPVGIFAARALYGRYLNAMLDIGMAGVAGSARLRLVPEEVVDLQRGAGGAWRLTYASGACEAAAAVVLAIGNLRSGQCDDGIYRADAWAPSTLAGLLPGVPVLVIGTGLTAMDLVVSLHGQGFPGPVIALSRRGLLPRRHAAAAPWPRPHFTAAERGSLDALLRRMRREIAAARAQGVDWRGVIDSVRGETQALWRDLPARDRTRFLRHLRPFWDVHRHRLAPPVADQIEALLARGYLRLMRGRFRGIERDGDAHHALVQRRGAAPERVAVQRVVNATGVESAARCQEPLLTALLGRGLVRLDPTGLGIEVTEALRVVAADGSAAANMWALGPIVRGVFWECTAVPDIRIQASRLALQMAL